MCCEEGGYDKFASLASLVLFGLDVATMVVGCVGLLLAMDCFVGCIMVGGVGREGDG